MIEHFPLDKVHGNCPNCEEAPYPDSGHGHCDICGNSYCFYGPRIQLINNKGRKLPHDCKAPALIIDAKPEEKS